MMFPIPVQTPLLEEEGQWGKIPGLLHHFNQGSSTLFLLHFRFPNKLILTKVSMGKKRLKDIVVVMGEPSEF